MLKKLTIAALASGALAAAASADTIATFDDPALDGSTPLFHFVSGIPGAGVLTGGWSGTGLELDAPGLVTTTFSDATFTMSSIAATGGPVFWSLGAGQIDFRDSSNQLIFTITFQGGQLTSPTGVGASDFLGQGVTFSGPALANLVTNEAFAFSFANPIGTLSDYTVTAAFTSSATVVPEPASLALLVLGGLLGLRRRGR